MTKENKSQTPTTMTEEKELQTTATNKKDGREKERLHNYQHPDEQDGKERENNADKNGHHKEIRQAY